MSRRLFLLSLVTLLGLTLTSCDLSGSNESGCSLSGADIFFANQGNFGDANGSVGAYSSQFDTVTCSSIGELNSIVQGITLQDENLFVTANTGSRVDIFSSSRPSRSAQVSGVNGPRYTAISGDTTAYVTDQPPFRSSKSPAVRIIDIGAENPSIVDSVIVSGTPEGITVSGSHAYAALAAFGTNTNVAKIDITQRTLDNTIDVGCATREVVADTDGDVFALCSDAAEAVILDGESGTIQTRLALPDTAESASGIGHPSYYAASANELYVATDTDLIRIDTGTNTVDATIDVGLSGAPGAVGYDPTEKTLYVARVAGFTTSGSITLHARDGTKTGSFDAGIAPAYLEIR